MSDDRPKKKQGRKPGPQGHQDPAKMTPEYNKPVVYKRSPMGNTGTKHLRAITNSGKKIYDRLFQMLQTDDPDNRPKDADVIKASEILLNRLYGPVPTAQLHVQSQYNPASPNNSPIPSEIRVVGSSATNSELHDATLYLKEHLNRIKEAEDKRVRDSFKNYDRLEGKDFEGVLVKKDTVEVWKDDNAEARRVIDEKMGANPYERKIILESDLRKPPGDDDDEGE